MFGIDLYIITQIAAALLAAFGMIFGLGSAAWLNYKRGRSQFPVVYIWAVCLPMTGAMLLRAFTFLISPITFWVLLAVDLVAVVINLITIAQHFGYFLRKPTLNKMGDQDECQRST